jgi:hypothetical protein
MTQQMGSASGTAPASRETEATPGGASELMSESMTNGEASGGTPGVTEADWQEPGSTVPAGPAAPSRPGSVEPAVRAESPDGSADGTAESRAARMRGWLRRTPSATGDVAPVAPSVVAAGPELDLASNDPPDRLPAQRGQCGGHHPPGAAVPGAG